MFIITQNNLLILLLLPAALILPTAIATTTPSPVPTAQAPTGYFLRSCSEPHCNGSPTLFDNNVNGDGKCHPVPENINSIAVEAHNWCVNLYAEPDCKGARLVAQSDWGACSNIHVAGKTFGGSLTDVPDWTVRSYIANAGDVPVKGTQLVPSTKVEVCPPKPQPECQCNSCCPYDGYGARRLRRS